MIAGSAASDVQKVTDALIEVGAYFKPAITRQIGHVQLEILLITPQPNSPASVKRKIAHRLALSHLPQRLIVDGEIGYAVHLAGQAGAVIPSQIGNTVGSARYIPDHYAECVDQSIENR